jgi:hypothetical protein
MSLRTSAKRRSANPRAGALKRCCSCREWKPLTAFARSRHTVDGFTSNCRPCKVKYQRERSDRIPRTSAELLSACEATAFERALVDECVAAMRRREAQVVRHFSQSAQTRASYEATAADRILSAAGIDWRRQVPLLSAAVAMAREGGLTLGYTVDGKLRRGLRGRQAS